MDAFKGRNEKQHIAISLFLSLFSDFSECISCTSNNDFSGASHLLMKLFTSSVKKGSDQSIEELVLVIQDVLNMAGDENAQDKVFDGMDNKIDEQVYLPSIIVDILWLLDQDDSLSQEERRRLNEIGRSLLDRKMINSGTATERLEPDFLEAIQVIPDAKAFDKKIVRTKTNLLYKQTKFNLLREESEGYSKLCVEMVEHLVQPLDYYWSADKAEKKITHQDLAVMRMADIESKTKTLMENITCLIGYFDMDPIRVLDIILDGFIAQCLDYWDFYVCLLKKSPWKPLKGIPKQVVAQVLGFKFRFYTRAEEAANTPVQLYWTAAVLIREGIVALDDLYSHLDPEDEKLKNEYFEYLSNLQKIAAKAGRFAATKMMGSLDEGSTGLVVEEEKKTEDIMVAKSQKAGLLKAISALGDIKHTRIMLDRVPTLSKTHADIADNICRILHVVVEDLDKPLRPFANISRKDPPSIHEFPPPVSSFNSKLTPNFERINTGKKHYPPQYKFFYDNWRDQAPRPTHFAGLLKVLRALLPYVGAHLYRDVLLTGKLIRLGRKQVKESINDESVKSSWLAIISQFIFPALSQMPSNPSLTHELWMFVKLWPYSVRYALYGEWKSETYEKIPELAVASAGCRKDIQYIMNRLSKDNIKTYGRLIGKIVHSNPTIAFSYILNAIESYDNMIPFVVEATRYLTALEFDILSFCLIEALARESKVRIERNGTTIEKWLKSLSNFSGTLFAKYKMELDGILKYLANQLISDQVYDLIVLQEVITSMSGISPPEDATAAQLECMAGGEVIRRESMATDSHSVRRSTHRLVQSLLKTGLALPLGVLLAQQTKEIGFRLGNEDPFSAPDLKVIAWLNDQCQKSFLQYFEFLENNAGSARYAKFCPTLTDLIEKYGIDVTSSFHIIRPHLSNLMKINSGALQEVKDIESAPSPASTNGEGEEMDVDEVVLGVDLPSPLLDISNQVANLGIKKDLSLAFYVTFWQLGLSDITVPHSRYELEIKKKEEMIIALDKENGRGSSKRRKEKERMQIVIQELKQELASQKESYVKTQERLQIEKEGWFAQLNISRSEVTNQILQNCIIPRSMFSAGDALYCAKFLDMLHDLGTANLSIVSLYDRIFNRDSLHAVVFSLTESEAKNFGAFLCLCLQKLTHWHSRKSIYDKQALANNRPGFLVKFPDTAVTGDDLSDLKMFEYEDFRTAMHKWHLKMRKCFLKCLSSGDYMQLRNGMIILNKISEYFPLIDYMGKELESSVSKIEKKEERADVKQMARSYFANLRRRKSFWVPTSKFCNQSKSIPVEDEVAEMHENSSVADITENIASEILNEDGAIESGEVKGDTSEMDIVETSVLEVNILGDASESGQVLETKDSVKRIVSINNVENIVQEGKKLEESNQSIDIEDSSANESKEMNVKGDRVGRDHSSKSERHDSGNRNSRDDRSRRDDNRQRDGYQRDFNKRDDGSKDSSKREDRNQKRDDFTRDTRRDDSQKDAKRDDWNQKRDDFTSQKRDDFTRDTRRDDSQKDAKRDDSNQKRDDFTRDSRRDDRVQRRDDTFSRDSNRKDESNRDSSKRDEKANNRELRVDGRNDSNRNQDERGKEKIYERSYSNNDRSSDSFRDEKKSRKDDDRGVNERKRPLPEEPSLTSREDQRPEQRTRREHDRSIPVEGSLSQTSKPKGGIADKIRQISREEKDRLLLARIDMEKRSFEQNKQVIKPDDSKESKNKVDDVVVKVVVQPSSEGQTEKRKVDESKSESVANRPRFERPSRSNSKAPLERSEDKIPVVVVPSEPNLSEEVTSVIREDSQRSSSVKNDDNEVSHQESKRNTLSKDQDYNNNRNEFRKNSSNREGQDSNGKRDESRKDSASRDYQRDDFNKRGNYRHHDRRGGGGGESYGNRGGRSSGSDRDSRRNDDHTQRKGGNQQQYNRGSQRGRDESKRGSDERVDRNDAKRFKIVR